MVVYERADRVGGLLRYGIPEFKMEKRFVERRLAQMRAEGTGFRTSVDVGVDVTADRLRADVDAVLLTGGATAGRDLPVPGRELSGVHQAMEYLPPANRVREGDTAEPEITAADKHVVVIGGGDTGADCLGTATRQGARSVTQLEIMPRPSDARTEQQPWPTHPMIYRVSSAHEENGDRVFAVSTTEFVGDADGRVRALRLIEVRSAGGRFEPVPGTEREIPADLVLLAMGFTGPERGPLLDGLGVRLTDRGTVWRDEHYRTSADGVFCAGDMGRGQSLIVWAIAEGRSAAASVDAHLAARDDAYTPLPSPVEPTTRPLT